MKPGLPSDAAFAEARTMPEIGVVWAADDWPSPLNIEVAYALCENGAPA